jgi:hypothetical protein
MVFVGTDPRMGALSFESRLCDGYSERLSPRLQWLRGLSRNPPFMEHARAAHTPDTEPG